MPLSFWMKRTPGEEWPGARNSLLVAENEGLQKMSADSHVEFGLEPSVLDPESRIFS